MKKLKIFAFFLLIAFALGACQSDDVMQDLNIEDEKSGKDIKAVGKALPQGPSTP